jgi:tRNA(Ile)-lysidine synthetase-like protein
VLLPAGHWLLLRGRQPGDRFAPLGLRGHSQPIRQWLSDRKVPRGLRDRVPLLVARAADGGETILAIAWGGRWTISDRALHGPDGAQVVYVFHAFGLQ